MTYIKVYWKHVFPDEPVLLFSEIDDNRNEIRKVEIYKNESIGYAWGDISRNGTFLSECELPELSVINEDTQFEGIEIEKEEFEKIWKKAIKLLFNQYNESFYYCSLITDGEGHCPLISAWSEEALQQILQKDSKISKEDLKWSYADSPYYAFGGEFFDKVKEVFDSRSVSVYSDRFLEEFDDITHYMIQEDMLDNDGNNICEKLCKRHI